MKELGSTRRAGYIMAISGGVLWAVGGAVGQHLFRTNTITTKVQPAFRNPTIVFKFVQVKYLQHVNSLVSFYRIGD